MRYRLEFATPGCPTYRVDEIIGAAEIFGYSGEGLLPAGGKPTFPALDEVGVVDHAS